MDSERSYMLPGRRKVLEIEVQDLSDGVIHARVLGLDPIVDEQLDNSFNYKLMRSLAADKESLWLVCAYPPPRMPSRKDVRFCRAYLEAGSGARAEPYAWCVPVFFGWESDFYPFPESCTYAGWNSVRFDLQDEDIPQVLYCSALSVHARPREPGNGRRTIQELISWGKEERPEPLESGLYGRPEPPWPTIALKEFDILAWLFYDGNGMNITCNRDAWKQVQQEIEAIAEEIAEHDLIKDWRWSGKTSRLAPEE